MEKIGGAGGGGKKRQDSVRGRKGKIIAPEATQQTLFQMESATLQRRHLVSFRENCWWWKR